MINIIHKQLNVVSLQKNLILLLSNKHLNLNLNI